MDNYTYMLTIDRTSNGEYENQATSLLFGSRREAEEYVDSDFIQVVKSTIDDELTADELSAKIEETCKWDGEEQAQFRYGDTIVDYKIEKVLVPPTADCRPPTRGEPVCGDSEGVRGLQRDKG